MVSRNGLLLILSLPFWGLPVIGQEVYLPLNSKFQKEVNYYTHHRDQNLFTASKPFLVDQRLADSLSFIHSRFGAVERLANGHLLRASGPDFSIGASPMFDLQYFKVTQPADDSLTRYENGRGIWIEGTLGDKVWFNTWFSENQAVWPGYIAEQVSRSGVVPGSGRTKAFKSFGVDYAMAGGALSYSPLKGNFKLNLHAGTDKLFFGNGYRSLLLSDNAFNYPFLKITSGWKEKLRYYNVYAILQTLERTPKGSAPESVFFRKNGTFHYISVMPLKGVELGLFEGVIFQVFDSTVRQALPATFYAPVIFLNSIVHAGSWKHNSLVGINARYTPWQTLTLYGQFATDDISAGRNGFQAGARIYGTEKFRRFALRAEYNQVAALMYSHDPVRENYAHYNQALGHPLGNDFREWNAELTANVGNLFIGIEGLLAYSRDSTALNPWGNRMLEIPDESELSSLRPVKMQQVHGWLAYRINSKYNLVFTTGMRLRFSQSAVDQREDSWVYISLSTALRNRYFDF